MRQERKISVGPYHFGAGRRFSKTECPIAFAIRQQLGSKSVSVDLDRIVVGRLQMRTPPHVADAVMAIDVCAPVEPFQFSLEV
jgi:hypothetical protein